MEFEQSCIVPPSPFCPASHSFRSTDVCQVQGYFWSIMVGGICHTCTPKVWCHIILYSQSVMSSDIHKRTREVSDVAMGTIEKIVVGCK